MPSRNCPLVVRSQAAITFSAEPTREALPYRHPTPFMLRYRGDISANNCRPLAIKSHFILISYPDSIPEIRVSQECSGHCHVCIHGELSDSSDLLPLTHVQSTSNIMLPTPHNCNIARA